MHVTRIDLERVLSSTGYNTLCLSLGLQPVELALTCAQNHVGVSIRLGIAGDGDRGVDYKMQHCEPQQRQVPILDKE